MTMTAQTAEAVEATKEVFAGRNFTKFDWNREVRSKLLRHGNNATLKTVLRYLEHEMWKVENKQFDDDEDDWSFCVPPIKVFRLK